jgi:pimeloyl-ACP methyl ester carboxylesterase
MEASIELSAWISAGETRVLRGRRIFTRVAAASDRPALLLIHGYPTASFDWHPVWSALASRYSLYTLDLLGFGSSEKPRHSRYAIAEQAALCLALLDHCGVREFDVLAHDYGDTVAQELLARELEDRVALRSVAFLNGGLFPETHRARRVQKLLATPLLGPLLGSRMLYEQFVAALKSIWGPKLPSEQELQDMWSLAERNDGRRALARLINYMEQRRRNRGRWVGALVETRVPGKLICGAVDPVSGAHMADRYRELVPKPDVTLLADVGHYPQVEAPDRVLEAYFGFRDKLTGAQRR